MRTLFTCAGFQLACSCSLSNTVIMGSNAWCALTVDICYRVGTVHYCTLCRIVKHLGFPFRVRWCSEQSALLAPAMLHFSNALRPQIGERVHFRSSKYGQPLESKRRNNVEEIM